MNPRSRVMTALCAVVMLASVGPDAQAARVWDRVAPSDMTGGLEAIEAHPTDPQTWWVSDGRKVWVTDDAGESYHLVIRATGAGIERHRAERDEDDASDREHLRSPNTNSTDPADPFDTAMPGASTSPSEDSDDLGDSAAPAPRSRKSRVGGRGRSAIPAIVERVGSRLRFVADKIFLCGVVGLWSADASARTLGTDREHRFGRSVPVFDVVEDTHGKRWVATSKGLFVLREGDRAMPTRGNASRDPVVAMQVMGRYLVGGNPDGLWIGDGHYVVRLGLLSGTAMPLDVLVLDDTRIAVATGDEVWFLRFPADSEPRVERRSRVPGAHRLATSADGRLLAAGPMGLWVEEEPGSWTRSAEGLSDRRLRDVAGPAAGGTAISLVVSRSGAFRYISDLSKLMSDRGRSAIGPAIAGAPSARATLLSGYASRHVAGERVSRWRTQQALSFLMPTVSVTYQSYRARNTSGLLVEALEKVVFTDVQVIPDEHELRIFARWDLSLIFFANPDFGGALSGWGRLATETRRVLDDRIEIRDTVIPLHNLWVEARVKSSTHVPADSRAAVKRILELQRIEADLYALTSGGFRPPPMPNPSASRSQQGEFP